jgi:hypothetical protein
MANENAAPQNVARLHPRAIAAVDRVICLREDAMLNS